MMPIFDWSDLKQLSQEIDSLSEVEGFLGDFLFWCGPSKEIKQREVISQMMKKVEKNGKKNK